MGGERRVLALRRADIGGSPEYREADLAVKGDVIEIGPRGGKIVGHRVKDGKLVAVYQGGEDDPMHGVPRTDRRHLTGWTAPGIGGATVNQQGYGHKYEIETRLGEYPSGPGYEAHHVSPEGVRTHLGTFKDSERAKRETLNHYIGLHATGKIGTAELKRGPSAGPEAPAAKLSAQTAERAGGAEADVDALLSPSEMVRDAARSRLRPKAQGETLAEGRERATGGAKVVSLADRRQPAAPAAEPPKPPPRPDTTERHQGAKYQSGRDTAEIARLFREDVKAAIAAGELPKGLKLAVKTKKFSGGSDITVTVQAAPGVQVGNPARHAWNAANPSGAGAHAAPDRHTAEGKALKSKLEGMLQEYQKYARDSMSDYHATNFFDFVNFDSALEKPPAAASSPAASKLEGQTAERAPEAKPAPESGPSATRVPLGTEGQREHERTAGGGYLMPGPGGKLTPAAKLAQQSAAGAPPNVASAAPTPKPAAPPPKPGISQTLARQIAERRPTLELGGGRQTDLAGPPSRKTYVSAEIQRAADDVEKRIAAHEKLSAKTGEWSSREALNRYINEAKRGIVELRGLMRRAESEGAHGGNLGTRLLTLQTNLRHAEQHLEDARFRTAKPASESLPLFSGQPKPNRVKPPGGQGDLFGKAGGSNPRQGSLF